MPDRVQLVLVALLVAGAAFHLMYGLLRWLRRPGCACAGCDAKKEQSSASRLVSITVGMTSRTTARDQPGTPGPAAESEHAT